MRAGPALHAGFGGEIRDDVPDIGRSRSSGKSRIANHGHRTACRILTGTIGPPTADGAARKLEPTPSRRYLCRAT